MKGVALSSYSSCITITFGDQAENHVGMEKLGKMAAEGFSLAELKEARAKFEERGAVCELLDLRDALCETEHEARAPEAAVLIVRGGANVLLEKGGKSAKDMYEEQNKLGWDTKFYNTRPKKTQNKRARYNLCFSTFDQAADFDRGKGTVVSFDRLPCLSLVRNSLPDFLGAKAKGLVAEGNKYYDVTKCGIGYHGKFFCICICI